jgi:hypothetical protein
MQDWVQDVDVAIVGLCAWRQTGPVDCGSRKLRPASKSTRYGEAGSHITITLADAAGGTDVLAVHAGLPPGVTHVFGGRSGNRSAISERAARGTQANSTAYIFILVIRVQEDGGSNPLAPTTERLEYLHSRL